jgi:cytochrome c peroxidase
MHNGTQQLGSKWFYNKGGGAGLGFDLPHQSITFDELNLSKEEIGSYRFYENVNR